MKLHFIGVNTNKLHDELIASGIVPQLVESLDNDTWITVDDSQVEAVNAVVAVHVPVSLTDAQATKIAEIEDTSNQYLQTFQSAALGTPHTYLSALKDIALLDGEFTYVNSPSYQGEPINWYTVEQGYVDHSGQQFIQVWLDGRSNMRAVKEKAAGLIAQVQAATTVEAVNAIPVVFP